MNKRRLSQAISIALLTGGLAACGGGGGGTTAGGSITTVGTITGFGSVFVNGVKYETGSSSYSVDDDSAFDDSALAIGMKVKVEGTVSADGRTGVATYIEYDDDLEGPIDPGSLATDPLDPTIQTFTVFGIPVKVIDGKTIFDDGLSFATLAEDTPVEVSGYFDGTHLVATYIEDQGMDSEFEAKGTVANYFGGTSFDLEAYGTVVTVDISAVSSLPPGFDNGMFVEVKGSWDGATFNATFVELDDADYLDDDDDDVELRGLLTSDGTGGYLVNSVPLLITEDIEIEDTDLGLAQLVGMYVEVEGFMESGVLVVTEIGFEDGDIEIEGDFGGVTGTAKEGTVTVSFGSHGSVTVNSTNGTMIHDDGVALNLADLNGTRCAGLEVDAYADDLGALIATRIECDDTPGAYQLEGPVETWSVGSSITILGVTFSVDGMTLYEGTDASFTGIDVGSRVEIDDTDRDGIAEKVELDS